MAANSSVYSANTLQAYSTSENNTLALLPLNLAEYNGDMKTLFYLDDAKSLKDKSNKDVFIGLVNVNGANYNMRPEKRIGKGRLQKDGVTYAVCNDGGLNTYAYAEVMAVLLTYANYIKLQVFHKAAYYSATYLAGVKIKRISGTQTEDYLPIFSNVPSKTSGVTTYVYQPSWLAQGDKIEIIPYTQNDENKDSSGAYTTRKEYASFGQYTLGTKIYFYNLIKISSPTADINGGTPYTVVISQEDYTKQYGLNALFASPSGTNGQQQTTVFPKGIQGVDNVTDATFTTALPTGYYYGVPTSWQGTNKEIIYIGANGNVTMWYDYTAPATSYRVTTTLFITQNESRQYVYTARVQVSAIVGSYVEVGIAIQDSFGGSDYATIEGTEHTFRFTQAGTQEVSYTFSIARLWSSAKVKVTSTYPVTADITENILTQ